MIDGRQLTFELKQFLISTRARKGIFESFAELEITRLKAENLRLQRQLSNSIQMMIDVGMELNKLKEESVKGREDDDPHTH